MYQRLKIVANYALKKAAMNSLMSQKLRNALDVKEAVVYTKKMNLPLFIIKLIVVFGINMILLR